MGKGRKRKGKEGFNSSTIRKKDKKSKTFEGDDDADISNDEIIEYLAQSNTINLHKIKEKMKKMKNIETVHSKTNDLINQNHKSKKDDQKSLEILDDQDNEGKTNRTKLALTDRKNSYTNEITAPEAFRTETRTTSHNISTSTTNITASKSTAIATTSNTRITATSKDLPGAAVPATTSTNQTRDTILMFEGDSVYKYKNYFQLHQEIQRLKVGHLIKNAYVNKADKLVIRTTYDCKSFENWPHDAFESGIKPFEKPKKYFGAMYNVDRSINLDDDNMKAVLAQYKIVKATRIIKKSKNEILETVRIEVNNKDHLNYLLKNGIYIGHTFFRIREWKFEQTVKICYKCLELGHLERHCKKEKTICMRCSTTHENHFKTCNLALKCIRCGESHAAVSKECKILKEQIEKHKQKQINNNKKREPTTDNNVETHINGRPTYASVFNMHPSQNQIDTTNSKIITFIVDIIANLETAVESIHEGDPFLKELIIKHFGTNMAKRLEYELKKYENGSTSSEESSESDFNNSMHTQGSNNSDDNGEY